MAVSPVDGRYSAKTAPLRQYFSEFAFIRNRVRVEVEYFIALCGIPLPQLSGFGEGTATSGFFSSQAISDSKSMASHAGIAMACNTANSVVFGCFIFRKFLFT